MHQKNTKSHRFSVIIFALLTVFLTCVYFVTHVVDAQSVQSQNINVQTINVFPGAIEGDGWTGVKRLYSQDLAEDALFGNFDNVNSAQVSKVVEEPIQELPPPASAPDETESSTTTSEVSDETSQTDEGGVPEEEQTEEDAAPLPGESSPEQESAPEKTAPEQGSEPTAEEVSQSGPGFKIVRILQRFASAIVELTESGEEVAEETQSGEQDIAEEPVFESAETNPEQPADGNDEDESTEVAVPEEGNGTPQVPFGEEAGESTATSSPESATTSPEAGTDVGQEDEEPSPGLPEVTEETSTSTLIISEEEEHAVVLARRTLSFSDFDIGSDFSAERIVNTQLRLSFAGKRARINSDDDEKIFIEYVQEGQVVEGGVVEIDDEVSNAINGGYFLYALPIHYNWEAFSDLEVRLTYTSKSGEVGSVYLDSLWLEVDFVDANEYEAFIAANKDVEEEEALRRRAPEGYEFEFLSSKKDFSFREQPAFQFRLERTKGNILQRVGSSILDLFRDSETERFDVRVASGRFKDIAEVYEEDGSFVLRLPKLRQFKPGKYVLTIEVVDGNNTFYIDQEFTWGVLAVNVDRSIYLQGEQAYIQMGVLDDEGHTICDAELELQVVDPAGTITVLSTDDNSIEYGDECAGDSYTTSPDYHAFYRANDLGEYTMNLTATTKNGVRSIIDRFEVREEVPFDVMRTGPTRIYPPELYPVTLEINAREDYTGEIVEYVPRTFQVFIPEGSLPFRTHEEGDTKQLIWDLSLLEGENYRLEYLFDAPDISPEFYLLGPLAIGEFMEIREWQIASDAVSADNFGGVAGTSFSFDIGSAGTNRLVAVFADDESTGSNLTNVTVDGNGCNNVTIADNSNGIGNHQELWYCDEDDLGSSNGSVTVAITGGDAGWGVHAHLYTNVTQSGPFSSGIDNTSNGVNTATVNNINAPESGLVVAGWGEGTDGLTESAQTSPLVTQLVGPDPGSADLFTGYGIETLPQTNKTYQFTFSGNHNRATGIVATWEPIRTTTVSAVGNQTTSLGVGATSTHVGGAFALVTDISTSSVTDITITENGTVDAQNDLDNIELYYELDTTAPYNCAGETYSGTETQFGSTDTDGFSGANGTSAFSGSVAISSTSAMCVYTILDVGGGASVGETLEIEISDASGGDVVVSEGEVSPGTPVLLSDTTTLIIFGVPEQPVLVENPAFDNLHSTTTPTLGGFVSWDDEGDDVEYEISIDNDFDFSSPVLVATSSNYPTDAGWASSTFAAGATTTYTVQPADALSDSTTYWWRVRTRDPGGSGAWSLYSETWSLTTDDALNKQGWHQTLGLQFERGTLSDTATTTGGVVFSGSGGNNTPTVKATDSDGFGGNTPDNDPTVTVPANAVEGDYMVVIFMTDDNNPAQTITPPATETWTLQESGSMPIDGTAAFSPAAAWIYTKAVSADDEANAGTKTYTWQDSVGSEEQSALLILLDNISGWGQFNTNLLTGNRTDIDAPSITTTEVNEIVFHAAFKDNSAVFTGLPSGTSTINSGWGPGSDAGAALAVVYDVYTATGTTGVKNFTHANNESNGFTFSLTPTAMTTGTVMSPEIDFAWVDNENDWGAVEWGVTEPAGSDTLLRLYHSSSTECDTIIPDGALSGNSTGFDVSDSGFFITNLSTTTYDRICMEMTIDQGTATSSPSLDDWTLSWVIPDQPPNVPLLAETPAFDNIRSTTTQPTFGGFSATDYEGDNMEFEIIIDDDHDFSSPEVMATSSDYPSDAGWSAATFSAGATTTYTVQSALTPNTTYWWRVRARDPSGSNEWGGYSESRSMTVNASYNTPQWYQTEGEQFERGTLISLATSTGAVSIDNATTTSILDTWTTGNTKTVSGGSDRLLVVVVTSEDSGTDVDVDTVTYGGQTLTQIEEQQAGTGFSNGIWMGYLDESGIQAAGSTTITPTWVGGAPDNFIQYASIVFENVDQADPIRGSSSNFNDSGSSIQLPDALSTEAGDFTIYASVLGQEGNTHTEPADYTEVTEQDTGGNGMVTATAYKYATTTTTEQPTATWSATFRMGIAGAVIRPGTATGSIFSREVDFDWVPNQVDWGEVTWSTTEPAGASTTLQLYYTNSTECDTIVPDGALTGNSAGFSFSDSPLDISGLSTTTYNRICLRMALDKGSTSTSPSLDDWTISWERNPILTQNYYQWYDNEDAEPPTDTWPPGSAETELGENEPITSSFPPAYGDVLRLSMTLLGSSTAASAGQFTYKLQYAQDSSCSTAMNWQDVGGIGSSTAAWRGYNNSSVADGATLSSTTISVTDVAETYEEENNSTAIPNGIGVGEDAEWDWVLEHHASSGVEYCFRMVQNDGTILNGGYNNYPQLITDDSPDVPTLEKLFDNEKTASTTPFFEFYTSDPEEDDVDYQIQIDNDADFSSTIINTNSIVNLSDFENLGSPADKSPYTHNETIRFTPATSFTNGNTYWWRVRSIDQNGSNEYSEWSTAQSFTVDTSVTVSTWFQTTEEQFDTDTLVGTDATGADLVTMATGSTTGTTTSSLIDFDWVTVGNAWGQLSWNDSESGGSTILYHIEYYNGSSWALIPDSDLSGNSAGFGSSPVDLIDLDTVTYNEIRIRANFTDTGTPPTLSDWTVSWGQRVSVPTHMFLFDNEKMATTTPTFQFFTTDPEGDDLEYEISWSTDETFTTGTTTRNSGGDTGFSDITTPASSSPYASGDIIQFTVQAGDALTDDTTYWWRVRARDPSGGNSYSFWSDPWSFTASSTTNVSTWYQTTQEQFDTNTLTNLIASTSDSVEVPSSVSVNILDAWTTGNSKTISAGSDRLLIFVVYSEDSGTSVDVNSATYGGQLLTEIGDQQQGTGFANGVWVGYLDEAGIQSASGNTLSVNWLGGTPDNFIQYASAVLENVDQTSPVTDSAGGTGTSGTTFQATTSVTVQEGDMAVYAAVSGVEDLTHTESTNYTEGTEENSGGDGMVSTNAYRSITVDSSEQPTATWSGTVNRHAMVVFTVNNAEAVTSGSITSTSFDFDDGSGPTWGQFYWNETEPGASTIRYHIQYLTGGETWANIPDGALPGNSSGFGTSSTPINLQFLDTSTYNELRLVADFTCNSGNCPELHDWTVEWSEGLDIYGSAFQYDQVSSTTGGTVAVAVNGVLQIGKTGSISNGSWFIDNVTYFPGDVITVFITGAADSDEAVGVTVYDGTPDITGMVLYQRHLSIGSDDNATASNTALGLYDFTNSEDLFFNVDGGNDLTMCADSNCGDAEIIILSGNTYQPGTGADVTTHDIEIGGTFIAGANTITVSGSWDNNGTTTMAASTVILTATTTSESIDSTGAVSSAFYNFTLGETSGTATWSLVTPLDVNNDLSVTHGTLARSTQPITVAGNLVTGANGFWSGIGTTTFDGSGTSNWTDQNGTLQNPGNVVIDGTSKTITLGSNVLAESITIGGDDILSASGSSFDITLYQSWINNNVFSAQSGEVFFAATTTNKIITTGSSAFYDLSFTGIGGSWSFTDTDLTVGNDLTIATGTVTMPTGTTTLLGSFNSAGGTFAHNNATVYFTSNGAETITASGTVFANGFYDMAFNGSGSWVFVDINATSSNDFKILQGAVTMPSGILALGGSFTNSGGSFAHNNGTLQFTSAAAESIDTNATFNSLLFSGAGSWSFIDSAVTVAGDVLVSNGVVTLPTTSLTIGGSLTNSASIAHNNGAVVFDSSDSGETIDLGNSSLYDVVFNSTTGGWTIAENATATNSFSLTNVSDFTLQSGRILTSLGTFSNTVGGASTTWDGSLVLDGASGFAINTKTDIGDAYSVLDIGANTDVSVWNSTSTSYVVDPTGSLYSQDHNGVDGDLYIFGGYERTSGTEHWSYETDFDGTDISGTPRQANVRFASGATGLFTGSMLSIVGSSTASTSIASQSGTYTVSVNAGTTTASFYEFDDLGSSGLTLSSSTDVTTLSDGSFIPSTASGSGITVSSTTIDANPALQIFRVNFATTSAISAFNVSQTDGTPSSFWWFRNGFGNILGENFDNDTGDPGSVRWDDSSLTITASGTVYADAGVTPLGAPTCDGATTSVRLVVEGGSTYDTACHASNGTYSIPGIAIVGDPVITVFLNTGGTERAVTVTKTPTADITDLDLYANRVIVRHEDQGSPLTIADMTAYDEGDDTDVQFVAATGSPDTLTVRPENELLVYDGHTFIPGGDITLESGGSGTTYDGTFHVGNNATATAQGTESHNVGGRFVVDSGGVFTPASSTVTMTATTTDKVITTPSPQVINFNDLTFAGVGGGWPITGDISVAGDMTVSTGTVSGTGDITILYGAVSGNGTVAMTSGTTSIERTNVLGGTTPWTFYDLALGNGSFVGTTTRGADATTTVLGVLNIQPGHTLDVGTSNWDLRGGGTPLIVGGDFDAGTGLLRYSASTTANVLSETYYDLDLNAEAGSPTYTAIGTGINVVGDLTIGGETNTAADFDTNDPVLGVGGDVSIRSNGTLVGSGSGAFTASGGWDNDGIFTHSGGTVTFDGTGTHTIAAGASDFGAVDINGSGSFSVAEHATATSAWSITNAGSFTLVSGNTLAVGGTFTNGVGGSATTWQGSVLSLYGGGNYEINASTTNDQYETLVVGSDTDIRMWNSSATTTSVNSSGSLYSQDHANVGGDLYIYGDYTKTSGTDYWSYATDFDGTPLGGSSRKVDVYFAPNATATYTGGGLVMMGDSSASTTLQNQGSGTYDLIIGNGGAINAQYYEVRDISSTGLTITGAPTVTTLANGDFEVSQNGATAITVGGTAINNNPAKNFNQNRFATSSGVSSAFNVTATGTSISSWRFVNHYGSIDGEAFDVDPADDPGYIVWDDSAATISIGGIVYSDEGSTVSSVCDGSTPNVHLRVAGLTSATTTCDGGDGSYNFNGISYSPNDSLIVYIDGETEQAASVTVDPISSIANMDLYENRVIVRHENTDPITIADMAVWDSSDDADIPFTAVDAGTDTLTLPANRKLIIWNDKTFEPTGNVTLSGGGAGADYDGSLELYSNAVFTANGTESHSIGGHLISGSGASITSANSVFTFTTTGADRIIDTNDGAFYDAIFNGSGNWDMTDTDITVGNNATITSGTVALPVGTTTIGGSFENTGGSFDHSSGTVYFTSTSAGEKVEAGGSDFYNMTFEGVGGSWAFQGTNATATADFRVISGNATAPSGVLAVGGNFIVNSGSNFPHNSGTLKLTSSVASTSLTLNGDDLFGLTFDGSGSFIMTDGSLAVLDDLTITQGTVSFATNTLSVGGSFGNSGTFNHSSGTMLFNSGSGGNTVDGGGSDFNNVVFAGSGGGWTILTSATTTGNFSITNAGSFTQQSGTILLVGGVFTNTVGGSATTWLGSTLDIQSGNGYTVNTKAAGGDQYDTLVIGPNTDIRMWDSSATTTNVDSSGSLYSQDNGGVSGALYIYGNYQRTTGVDYWSYATDFDGTALGGSPRAVNVYHATSATTTIDGGTLQIIGVSTGTTTIDNQGSDTYSMRVLSGTLDASYYSMKNLGASGLELQGTSTITSLSYGDFELAVSGGSLITVSSTTVNANASKIFTGNRFATTTAITGANVELVGTTANAWTFSGHYGNLDGEGFDIDGAGTCESIRWDDSSCLITQQAHYRWRNDNGGEGVPDSEWFDTDWTKRKRVVVSNNDASTYVDATVRVDVTYDGDMQADFDDLRFTDESGTTTIPYWIEDFTASTDAIVWVQVPTLATSSDTSVYMYYGNGAVSDNSSGSTTFNVFDDFEDNNITEYSGDTSLFQTNSSNVYERTYRLEAFDTSGKTTDGIYNTASTVSQGETVRYLQYIDTSAGSGDESCTIFGVQTPGSNNNNYGVCLELFGTDRVSISKDVRNTDDDDGASVLASTTITYVTGWHEVEVDWLTDDTINVTVSQGGSIVATTSTSDSSYTSGGYGYSFWFQNGGWDVFTSRLYMATDPTVSFGAEQVPGGATWYADLDTPATGILQNTTQRVRFVVENSDAPITDQNFLLEYAEKGSSPSCEAVDTNDYASVPVQSSCGSSPICMQSSTFYTNRASTTDILGGNGLFTYGQIIEDPTNDTGNISVNSNEFTEVEYALEPTTNATSSNYCFRVTDGGTEVDTYLRVAEMELKFDPSVLSWSLNDGLDISLLPGATTTIYATGTVSDTNGYTDLEYATATIYRSGLGPLCSADDNNCYQIASTSCLFSGCSGNTCDLSCSADIYFFAEPTDIGTYSAQDWRADLLVSDFAGGDDTQSTIGVELLTLQAILSSSSIGYGSLSVNADTGSFNPTTTISNIGNASIDLTLEGTDLTDGGSSVIPVSEQKYATTTFTYSSCTECSILSATTSPAYEVDLNKPTTTTPVTSDQIFWGIEIPFGAAATAHEGVNTFMSTSD